MAVTNLPRKALELMARAMERKKDKPKIEILAFMKDELERAKVCDVEPDWKKMFKEARRIWEANL